MIYLYQGFYLALSAVLVVFLAYLSTIVAAAVARRPGRAGAPAPGRARFLVVIPAHDEEACIRSTVESCRGVAYDPALFTVFVIADNCTDETARAAREAGAEVVERHDPTRRSKGHALEFFFDRGPGRALAGQYDAAVLVDADTVVDPGLLDVFARGLAEGKDWMQCYYTVRNPDASWRTRLMTYSFSLFNGVWLYGQDRLGLGVGLKGNGMCFSARGLRRHPWRAYGLTEDLEFSWMLRAAGERIHFLPGARVYAAMLSGGGRAAAAQRRRWEAGRRALRGVFCGPLLRARALGPFRKVMYLLDLFFPPLVPLLLALLAASSLHAAARLDPRLLPLAHRLLPVHLAMFAALGCYALSPFVVMGLPLRYLASLAALPYYAAWKVRVVLAQKTPTAWIRTTRETPGSEPAVRSTTLPGDRG